MQKLDHERIKAIQPGTVFKNKRSFCEAIGADYEKVKGGRNWDLFQERFAQCHGELQQDGRAITLLFVYPEEQPYIDPRGPEGIYHKPLQLAILATMQECAAGTNRCELSLRKWLFSCGFFNSNYNDFRNNSKANSKYTQEALDHFYRLVDSKSRDVFTKSIKSFKRKDIINYKEVSVIVGSCRHEDPGEEVSTTEYFNSFTFFDKSGTEQYSTHKANEFEDYLILHIETLLQREFGTNPRYKLSAKEYQEYQKKRSEYCRKLGWDYYYKDIVITWNREDLDSEIDSSAAQLELNKLLIDYYTRKIPEKVQEYMKKIKAPTQRELDKLLYGFNTNVSEQQNEQRIKGYIAQLEAFDTQASLQILQEFDLLNQRVRIKPDKK